MPVKTSGPSYGAVLAMPATLLSLTAGLTAAAVTGTWVPAVAAAASSAAYLALMAMFPAFRRAVRRNFEAQQLPELTPLGDVEALSAELAPSQRQHVEVLRALKDQTLERYRRLPGGRVLAASTATQFEQLLVNFVKLVSTLNAYRQFLVGADTSALARELAELEAEAAATAEPALKEVKARRADILRKRVQRYEEAEKGRELISHQLASIEDTFRLAHEQSVALRDPTEVGRLLETLTADVTDTAETWRAMEAVLPVTAELSSTASLAPAKERTR